MTVTAVDDQQNQTDNGNQAEKAKEAASVITRSILCLFMYIVIMGNSNVIPVIHHHKKQCHHQHYYHHPHLLCHHHQEHQSLTLGMLFIMLIENWKSGFPF